MMDAAAEIGRNPRFSLSMENEQADAGRDGRTHLARPISHSRETKFSGANGDREMLILPAQLTMSSLPG